LVRITSNIFETPNKTDLGVILFFYFWGYFWDKTNTTNLALKFALFSPFDAEQAFPTPSHRHPAP
jgi:hypothetical protein